MQSYNFLNDVTLSIILQYCITMNVITLSVILLSILISHYVKRQFAKCRHGGCRGANFGDSYDHFLFHCESLLGYLRRNPS